MNMTDNELIEKWLFVFGREVDKKTIEEHITSYCNYLWHLFTWGNVVCLEGEEARKAFDMLQYARAIKFYDGYSNRIKDVSIIGKVSAKEVDDDTGRDVYLVAEDFSWTYVRTHEGDCGPYLCVKG